jgi:hypothetical protein
MHKDTDTDKERAGSVDRRQFLGSMLTAAGGVAFAAVGVPNALAADATTPIGAQYMPIGNGAYEIYQIMNGKKVVLSRVAQDGLLVGSVFGTYVGTTSDGFAVSVPKISGTVDIQLVADTSVQAGGVERFADLSLVNPGDDVSVGTKLDADGRRVAEYVRANVMMGTVMVSAVSDQAITGTPLNKALEPVEGRPAIQLEVGPAFMTMPSPAPAVGEYWDYFATSSDPENPQRVWAHALYLLETTETD